MATLVITNHTDDRYELKHSEFVVKPPGKKLSTKGKKCTRKTDHETPSLWLPFPTKVVYLFFRFGSYPS